MRLKKFQNIIFKVLIKAPLINILMAEKGGGRCKQLLPRVNKEGGGAVRAVGADARDSCQSGVTFS